LRPALDVTTEDGLATLIALVALAIFALFGAFMALDATTEIAVGDNFESHLQAECAARAGLSHAGALVVGVAPDDLLRGPDGAFASTPSYLAQARAFGFRNPVSWATARSLDLSDPAAALSGLPDDGMVSTGYAGGAAGTLLIPPTGIALETPNPYGSGTVTIGRYFVKVTDNNGETSEVAGDPSDSPFTDGDGIFIVRSLGIARTLRDSTGTVVRTNAVAVAEARFRIRSTFDLDSPIVLAGSDVLPSGASMFVGTNLMVNGGSRIGVSTLDTDPSDEFQPASRLADRLAPEQRDSIQGAGIHPSIAVIGASVIAAGGDRGLLLDPGFLASFAATAAPQFADAVYSGSQRWPVPGGPDLGAYDFTRNYNDPGQRPRVVVVDGDLELDGSLTGGGLLVVRGRLTGTGTLTYSGLLLVIGAGEVDLAGVGLVLHGGLYVAAVAQAGATASFTTPRLALGPATSLVHDAGAVKMAVRLIPPAQISLREVTSTMDP
jgi:hypothetical protein